MKRLMLIVTLVCMTAALTACSGSAGMPKYLSEEGIAPYELSEGEKYILQSFGMEGASQVISFNAPKDALSLDVTVYRLGDGGSWDNIGGGGISIGTDRKPTEQLTGTVTMQLKEDYSIDLHVNSAGTAAYITDPLSLEGEAMASLTGFLQKFQTITLNTEIPVALMVYDSGSRMKSYALEDYFEPSKFDGMDLVQAVTLTFSDQA